MLSLIFIGFALTVLVIIYAAHEEGVKNDKSRNS